jgi:sugar lactone lactonase YvrE
VRAEQVTDAVAFHAEGPVWSDRWGGLRWVDMLAGDVLSLAADGTIRRRHVGRVAAALRPRETGGAVIAVERGFALEDADGTLTPLDPVWSDPGVRMNEGGCDPDGRFWCGSMAYDQAPGAAALYRLDPDGHVHTEVKGVTVSNGVDWSPDGSLAYYDDTATHRVDVFDHDRDTGLTSRRPFLRLPDDGNPDGLTVDAEGGSGGLVRRRGRAPVHRGRRPRGRRGAGPQVTAARSAAHGGTSLPGGRGVPGRRSVSSPAEPERD